MTDYWHILGLEPGASPAAVEAAYRTRAKTLHPDIGGDHDSFAALSQARTDARRASLRWPCATCTGTGRRKITGGGRSVHLICDVCGGSGKKWGL